ncbi:MAG: glycosyltransferase, partial [Promethearchaeota archaeon]
NNFTILNQKQGRGKITAINDAINQVSDGIIFLMDADVQVNDNLILNMIDPIINANEVVVTAGLKPHESIRNKDLVKFLYIDRNPRFRKKPVRYGDIIGIVTAIKYEVIQNINEFTVAKLSDDGRVIGKDLKKKNYKIYRIVELSGETYNFPEKISDFIPQQLRWMENAYYRRIEEGKKLFLLKKFLTTLLSIYLLIIPFLAFNINLIVIGLYILLFIYIKKIRKLIFFKKSEPSSIEINFNIVFYIKLIFYIYVEALLNVIVAIETIFFKDKYKKRKNIS